MALALSDADDDLDFAPHVCGECGRDVPGSPDDVMVVCRRCAAIEDRL